MPQLYFSVDKETAAELTRQAANEHVSLSRYLARVLKREIRGAWPGSYLSDVVGSCASDPLHEPDELALDDIDLDGSGQ